MRTAPTAAKTPPAHSALTERADSRQGRYTSDRAHPLDLQRRLAALRPMTPATWGDPSCKASGCATPTGQLPETPRAALMGLRCRDHGVRHARGSPVPPRSQRGQRGADVLALRHSAVRAGRASRRLAAAASRSLAEHSRPVGRPAAALAGLDPNGSRGPRSEPSRRRSGVNGSRPGCRERRLPFRSPPRAIASP